MPAAVDHTAVDRIAGRDGDDDAAGVRVKAFRIVGRPAGLHSQGPHFHTGEHWKSDMKPSLLVRQHMPATDLFPRRRATEEIDPGRRNRTSQGIDYAVHRRQPPADSFGRTLAR